MTLRASTTRVGAVAFDALTELLSAAANNGFDYDTYRVLNSNDAYWEWNGQTLTWSQWRALGQDTNSRLEEIV